MFEQKRGTRAFYSLFLLGALLLCSLTACGTGGNGGSGTSNTSSSSTLSGNIATPTSATTATTTPAASATTSSLRVTSVNIAVSPSSLSSYTCGTTVTVTYTATFNFPANNPGGQVTFQYTTDNGRGSSAPTSLNIQPGEPDTTYQFTWSGALPVDHTMPEPGGVTVTAPNSVNSPLVGPSGSCSSGSTAAFQVTSAVVTANDSLSGQSCGSQFTEHYTVTFTIAPNGPGGTINFTYSTDNGQSNTASKTVQVNAGQTTVTSSFRWNGKLPADHTAPGVGVVLVTAPNAVTSTGGAPDGKCN